MGRKTTWVNNGSYAVLNCGADCEYNGDCPQRGGVNYDPMMPCYRQACIELAKLEDKLESGQLIEFPCKVGDIVYYVDEYIAAEFDEVEVNTVEKIEIGKNEIRLWFGDDVGYVLVKNFGKEVFTDKSEAERRLAELKGGL